MVMSHNINLSTVMNQNLNVDLDLTAISQAIKNGFVKPRIYTDKQGVEHQTVCLFVKECKNHTDNKTHNVTMKKDDAWADVKDNNGNVLFFGKGTPSKYQPKANGQEAQARQSGVAFEDIF